MDRKSEIDGIEKSFCQQEATAGKKREQAQFWTTSVRGKKRSVGLQKRVQQQDCAHAAKTELKAQVVERQGVVEELYNECYAE